jgi:hypothetical protein
MHRFAEIRAACLPFVTRSLRGPRLRRTAVLSVVLSLVALGFGLWLAQGSGSLARELRQEAGFEQHLAERQRAEHTVLATDEWQLAAAQSERRAILRGEAASRPYAGGMTRVLAEEAWVAAAWAARGEGEAARLDPGLRERAAAAIAAHPEIARFDLVPTMHQQRPDWIRHALDRDLVPDVRAYASPLGLLDTVRIEGLLAGAALGVLLLLVLPLLAAVQIATEVHENTLQPLTGTALTTRQLLLGMVAGPAAVVGLIAAPHAATFLLAMLGAGLPVAGLGFLLSLSCASALLVALGQLVAAGLGKRRTPGMIAVAVLVATGGLGLVALVAGLEVSRETAGVVATLPPAGAVHLWHATFMPVEGLSRFTAQALDARIFAASVGFCLLAGVSQLAIERRVAERPTGLLRRGEALLAAVVLMALALMAMPPSVDDFAELYLASLAILVGPLQLLLMARVPTGDVPPSMRTLPLSRVLGEYGVVLGLHMALVLVVADAPHLDQFSFTAVVHLGWALGVAALVSIRGVAAPIGLAAKVWLGFALVCAMIELGIGAAATANPRDVMIPLEHADAIVALVYLGLFFWVPVSLGRGLLRSGLKLG